MVGCKGSYGTIKNLILPAALLGALTASRRYIRSAKVIVVLVTLFRAPTGVNSRGRTQNAAYNTWYLRTTRGTPSLAPCSASGCPRRSSLSRHRLPRDSQH